MYVVRSKQTTIIIILITTKIFTYPLSSSSNIDDMATITGSTTVATLEYDVDAVVGCIG